MADLLDFAITALGPSAVTVPRASIEGRIVDSSDQSVVIADLTGVNAVIFPAVIADLTAEQRRVLIRMIATWLLFVKAGLDPGVPL